MCGRVTITNPSLDELARELDAAYEPADAAGYRPRWNAAPTDPLFVLDAQRRLRPMRWGMPGRDALLINARTETVAQLSSFRESYEQRRCLLPVSGFYEWVGGKKDRRPLWFHPAAGALWLLAAIWDARGFVVLTTEANETVSVAHDRMPVIVTDPQRWLQAPTAELFQPVPASSVKAKEVSARVNDVKNDDATLLRPPPQLALF